MASPSLGYPLNLAPFCNFGKQKFFVGPCLAMNLRQSFGKTIISSLNVGKFRPDCYLSIVLEGPSGVQSLKRRSQPRKAACDRFGDR